ncbi:hypothetical protein G6F59_018602 [Rhizopus arrhizus]|nr:hypothetical protein G6F59_018602 [Rhizopus arrhizus]
MWSRGARTAAGTDAPLIRLRALAASAAAGEGRVPAQALPPAPAGAAAEAGLRIRRAWPGVSVPVAPSPCSAAVLSNAPPGSGTTRDGCSRTWSGHR